MYLKDNDARAFILKNNLNFLCLGYIFQHLRQASRDVLRLSLVTLDSNQGCPCRRDRIQ